VRLGVFRTTDIVLIAVMLAAAAFTYKTKHEADNELEHIHKLQAQIQLEQDRIDVLKADWSLLRQPARLQKLVEIYHDELDLEPVEPHQIAKFEDLPVRLLKIEDLLKTPLGGVVDAGRDQTVTGSVTQ